MVLALGMCSINGNAQTKKPVRKATVSVPKDSREYQVGKDGFEWYKVCNNGKWGAEDRSGKLLVPCEYKEISYYDFLETIPGIFFVKPISDNLGTGVYSQTGKCIIPITRNYHFVLIQSWNTKEVGACFQYCKNSEKGNTGICDISGKEIFEAQCHYDDIQPHYKKGKFYYEVGICESEWRHGIIDGNGHIIVPLQYEKLSASETGEYFYIWDRENKKDIIVGRFCDIVTNENVLADNIRMTASLSSSYSNSSSSSNGSSSSANSNGGTTTVVVEHHHDPIPVQEWQQCPACYGSGQCPYVKCGGSGWYYIGDRATTCSMCHGSGKCSTCAGKGGHYVTVYR